MRKVIFLFHLYQPPWQSQSVVNDYFDNRYHFLIKYFEDNLTIKATINIAGSLTDIIAKEKKFTFFDRIRKLVNRGQIELTSSAMYHPILPLIPVKETTRQIELNEEINKKYFKEEWNMNQLSGRGFYIPELAYSNEIAKIIKDKGFNWIPVDKSALGFHTKIDWNKRYIEKETKLLLFIRNSLVHNDATMMNPLKENLNLVFIEDGEDKLIPTKDNLWWNVRFKEILGDNNHFTYQTVGEYIKSLDEDKNVALGPSNWEITQEEYNNKSYYHIWDNKKDPLHQMLWKFINEIIDIVYNNISDKNYESVRQDLDKALSSCTWWWVDGRFNGYYPTAIQNGLDVMINVIRTLNHLDLNKRLYFEKEYSNIVYSIWKRHWEKNKI